MNQKTYLSTISLALFFYSFTLFAQNIPRRNVQGPEGIEVNSYTGNLFLQRTDMIIPAQGIDIDITFFYNVKLKNEDRGYGRGWTHTYDISHDFINGNLDSAEIYTSDGRKDIYANINGSLISPVGIFNRMEEYQSDMFRLTSKYGIEYYFENPAHRKVTRIVEPNGNTVTLDYTNSELATLSDATGRTWTFTWSNGHLATITDANDNPTLTYTYIYNNSDQLIRVVNPMQDDVIYTYGPNNELLGIEDENGNPVTIHYDAQINVKKIISCHGTQTFRYDGENNTTYVVENDNQVTKYLYDDFGRLISAS